jgi:D-alanyl-D-alanine endopeptidase (penicillin-binding protein 7)
MQSPSRARSDSDERIVVARPSRRSPSSCSFIGRATLARWPLVLVLTAPAIASAKPAFPPRTADNLPNVQSQTAIAVDMDDGTVLYAKQPDEVRPIASTGKIFVALVARARELDLAAETAITEEDRELAKGGARTRLPVGYSFHNEDLLRAMLVASDNRAPSAIGRAAGMTPDELVAAMNEFARASGLDETSFTDTSGLRGNTSTAREMVAAFQKALADPVLAEIMATTDVEIASTRPRQTRIRYRNTNRSLVAGRYEVIGGKTGYTDAARYCLLIAAKIGDRRVAFVFLGAEGKLTRYGDFNRVVDWILDGMPNADKAVK